MIKDQTTNQRFVKSERKGLTENSLQPKV